MVKLKMFAGRLLCTPDQISFNFSVNDPTRMNIRHLEMANCV